ncbi:protein spindle-F [Anopheles darlingi]|uniref:protein spindle-F n=1 Tax=Anopheles darlingi TaxID=43151 RepID=UPI00210010AD|nr:protein spindle-F [Anopheles darlingi]XP_049544048.1 protein spindle-F [Anopheles darlingi]XP_049544057.1 protein spindle-F [Anopheles darlingi]XP_049544065.1 protein spindle-F [Anopheles darlingi]XP_049544073.1 protein spindle-F [Anopheles darlingi]
MTDTREDACYAQSAQHRALQAALQTLKERCQTLQKRIIILEDENVTLRASQTKETGERLHDKGKVASTSEVEQLQSDVLELSRQKVQLAEQIAVVAGENRQLWRRLSQIVKDLPLGTGGVGMAILDAGAAANATSNTKLLPNVDHTGSVVPGAAQNLIRSRTFTKNAPNPKLRDRLPKGDEGTDDVERLLILEDVSLLNTCGFLEPGYCESGTELPPSGCAGSQGEETMQAALETNPELRQCTEGLLIMQRDVARQQQTLKNVLYQLKTNKDIGTRSKHHIELPIVPKPIMKDVTVEVHETELLPIAEKRARGGSTQQIKTPEARVTAEAAAGGEAPAEMVQCDVRPLDLALEKGRANKMEKICPMCGKLYGVQITFNEFQQHVESHFLEDTDAGGELSFDRTFEYVSQPVGNF